MGSLIARKKKIMMMQVHELDTSPRIEVYGKRFPANTSSTYIDDNISCITEVYQFPSSYRMQTINVTGGYARIRNYLNGECVDYWSFSTADNYQKTCLNSNTNGLALDMQISKLDVCHAYIVETGQILFAGKNSIYYGHKNISELN